MYLDIKEEERNSGGEEKEERIWYIVNNNFPLKYNSQIILIQMSPRIVNFMLESIIVTEIYNLFSWSFAFL